MFIFKPRVKKTLLAIKLGTSIKFVYGRPDEKGVYKIKGKIYKPLLEK